MIDVRFFQSLVLDLVMSSDFYTNSLKEDILSYLFFNLCWDFDYGRLKESLNIQHPRAVGRDTDILDYSWRNNYGKN